MGIWNWNPFFVAVFIFLIDFGFVFLIRVVFEKKVYLGRWWTYRYGDSIFLPILAYFLAITYQKTTVFPYLYQQPWWHISVFVFGYILMAYTEYLHIKNKVYKKKDLFLPSQLYHSFIFGIFFYTIVGSLPLLFPVRFSDLAYVGIIFGSVGFLLMCVKDFIFDSGKPMKMR